MVCSIVALQEPSHDHTTEFVRALPNQLRWLRELTHTATVRDLEEWAEDFTGVSRTTWECSGTFELDGQLVTKEQPQTGEQPRARKRDKPLKFIKHLASTVLKKSPPEIMTTTSMPDSATVECISSEGDEMRIKVQLVNRGKAETSRRTDEINLRLKNTIKKTNIESAFTYKDISTRSILPEFNVIKIKLNMQCNMAAAKGPYEECDIFNHVHGPNMWEQVDVKGTLAPGESPKA